ncbi:kinase-like protein [Auriscalpium vulgare]|uniref:Kinase-like protein n=1 Tax=Auriscalpium vulgare TaxID=40419 RepID=A0ACB8RJX9_9AGAM|nr:kinase-like protein [Auriscalpium vulgare]
MWHTFRRLPVLRRFLPSATPPHLQNLQNTHQGASAPTPPDWAKFEEPLEGYGSDFGYLPVAIGDVLDSRYVIKRKLGWGNHSTVWLAEQQNSPRFSALKILTSGATDTDELHELEYLQEIRDKNATHPGHAHNVQLLDHFYHEDNGARHLCLVTEPMCETLSAFAAGWQSRALPIPLVRQVARQVLFGLDYLHSECNIIHTDLKPSNIMFAPLGDPTSLLAAAATAAPFDGHNETSVGLDPNGRSIARVPQNRILFPIPENLKAADAWRNAHVKLADVGVACWADKVSECPFDVIQSPALRAPEVCIGAEWGKPADVWSFGCMIYELCLGKPIFPPKAMDTVLPVLQVEVFGDYPLELVQRGRHGDAYFNSDGSSKHDLPRRISLPFDQLLSRRSDVDQDHLLVDFMKRILTLDPDRRPTCQELLTHEWVNSQD